MTGLPPGLSYTNGQVRGTVSTDASAQDYPATIAADDGVNAAVTAAFTVTVIKDQTRPTVSIDGPVQAQRGAFWVSIVFSEPVEGFEQTDVTVGNGVVRKFTGSGASYRAEVRITPGYSGTVTVDVAADVAVAADGDGNLAANRYSVAGDQSRPTTTVSGPSGVQDGPFEVSVTFSESVQGFEASDVMVGNGSVTSFSGSGASYTVTVTPSATGTVTVDVDRRVATDLTGNPNQPAERYSVEARLNAPPEITSPGHRTYELGESITAFGIAVSVCGLGPGDGDGDGSAAGAVVHERAGAGHGVDGRFGAGLPGDDRGGTTGVNAAVTAAFTVTVIKDQTRPTVSIDGPVQAQRGAFWVSIVFSEPVEGFEQTDVTVGNGVVRKFTGSGASYRAEVRITPGYSGTVTVDVAADVAVAADGDGNLAANRYSVAGDQSRPTTTVSGPSGVQDGPFEVSVTFSESVQGFEASDVMVGNGSVTSFSGSGASYTVTVTPSATGTVTVDVDRRVATDLTGNPNQPAERYSVEARLNAPPEITSPGHRTYELGESITAFGIAVSDAGLGPG